MCAGRVWPIVAVVVIMFAPEPAKGAITALQRMATGLNLPVFATHAPGDRDRLFVLEKPGNIKIVDLNGGGVTGTFLTIGDTDQVSTDEGGLLGMAFHPNYNAPIGTPGRGKFYVYVTVDNNLPEDVSPFSTHIREYTVLGNPATSNQADPNSMREILQFTQPQDNHNAGWIGFSPNDGYLYIASGDGGGAYDSGSGHSSLPDAPGNAQDLSNNLLGKMLRIEVGDPNIPYAIPSTNPFVSGPGDPDNTRDDEIWSYGLRNPYRNGFDRLTGDLWIGDVGQGQREEIDFQPASSEGGENYGWRLREGNVETNGGVGGPPPADYVAPIYDYTRGNGSHQGRGVNGGYAYRGPDPDLQGLYFFSDSQVRNVWSLDPDMPIVLPPNANPNPANINGQLGALFSSVNVMVSFAEDAVGNLYIVDYTSGGFPPIQDTGEIYRIVTDALLAGDFDADGDVDFDDYDEWVMSFGGPLANPAAEDGGNGIADAADYITWRKNFGASVHAGLGAGSLVPEPLSTVYVGQLILLAAAIAGRRRSTR